MAHIHRREFLGLIAVAAVGARVYAPRLRVMIPTGDLDLQRGVIMSVDEAQRAAALFGGSVELAQRDGDAAFNGIAIAVGEDTQALHMNVRPVSPLCRRMDFDVAPLRGLAWHPSLTRFGADTLNKRFTARYNAPMSAASWCAWFSVKCAWEAALRSKTRDTASLAAFLETPEAKFDGHKGVSLWFDGAHRLVQPVYDADGRELAASATEARCGRQ